MANMLPKCSHKVADQIIWALSNLAGDCHQIRDKIVDLNLEDFLMKFVETNQNNETILQNVSWFISNLCRLRITNEDHFEKFECFIAIIMR